MPRFFFRELKGRNRLLDLRWFIGQRLGDEEELYVVARSAGLLYTRADVHAVLRELQNEVVDYAFA